MAQVDSAGEARAGQRGGGRPGTRVRRWAANCALLAAAGAWFSLGAPLTLEWIDEGQIVYPIWRTAAGAVAYRDFGHAYWPGLFVANGLLLRAFGEDLAVLRAGLVVLKAWIALSAYRLARELVRPWLALVAWAVLLAVWGAPLWIFNTPYANHYALALGLAASLVLLGAGPRYLERAALAGLFAGCAATFKHTTGAFIALAGLAFLASELERCARRGPPAWFVEAVRMGSLGAAALAGLLYALRSPLGWTTCLVVTPALAALLRLGFGGAPGGSVHLRDLAVFAAAAAAPVLACVGVAAWLGTLAAFVHETLSSLGEHATWAVALPAPDMGTVGVAATVAAWSVAASAWRRGRAAQATGATALAAGGTVGLWAGSGGFATAALHWAPVLVATLSTIAWWAGAAGTSSDDRPGRAFRLAVLFAGFMLLTLHPGADLPHALMILPAVLPLMAWLADRLLGPVTTSTARALPAAALVVLLAVATGAPFVSALWQARRAYAQGIPRFARASGIWQDGAEYANVADLVERLDTMLPPGAPVVVLPSEQMIYFLAGRPSAIERDEFALYLIAANIVPPTAAPTIVDEEALQRRLDMLRPVVVIDDREPMLGRLRRALPGLAHLLDTRCERVGTVGAYTICRLTPAAGTTAERPGTDG